MLPDKLIIFDCDGVLVDSEIIGSTTLSNSLHEINIPYSIEDCLEKFIGLSAESICDKIIQAGGALPEDFATIMRERTFDALSKGVSVTPGVYEALKALKCPICVASSGLLIKIRQSLSLAGLSNFFDDNIFSAEQVENGKPAPDLFLYAAESMEMPIDLCVVVEDSVAGVIAAKQAGMRVIGYLGGSHVRSGHKKKLQDAGADVTISNMVELLSVI